MSRRLAAALFAIALAGCGDTTVPADAAADRTAPVDLALPDLAFVPPPAPSLGAQIDRVGRPAVTTALLDPFDTLTGRTPDQAKDAYNAAADPAAWDGQFRGDAIQHQLLAGTIAFFDGIDTMSQPGDGCGSQLFADANATRYDALAGILADDQLYLDSSQSSCVAYLALEVQEALGVPVPDCGGRTPTEDVVDETYSALAIGEDGFIQTPNGPRFVFTDGVDADPDGAPSLTAFPFLSPPN